MRMLRLLAAGLLAGALGAWLALGANCGWTKTSAPVAKTDEVTGLVYQEYRSGFFPGLDFLGAALISAALTVGASFLLDKKEPITKTNQT